MPKGDCFRAAYRRLQEMTDEAEPGVTLCHGIITSDNGTFVHAWIEKVASDKTYVFDVATGHEIVTPGKRYYELLSVRNVVRYGPDQARIEFLRNGHWGPWDVIFDDI